MRLQLRYFRIHLRTTALCGAVAAALASQTAVAFNPGTGAEAQEYSRVRSHLPSTAPLVGTPTQITFPEVSGIAARQALMENQSVSSNRLPPAVISEAPSFPPVDAATQARAQQELQAAGQPYAIEPAPLTVAEQQPAQSFIAPAPLMAPIENPPMATAPLMTPVENPLPSAPPVPVAMAPMPEPLAAPDALAQPVAFPVMASADPVPAPPAEELSNESKRVVSTIPSKLDTKKAKGGKMKVNRMSPELHSMVAKSADIESYDSVGLSIKVQRPGLDSNFELNRAYNALMGGDTTQAVEIYKNVLSSEPDNEDALFGIASIYHRGGDLERARPYYARLLKVNPDHRDGLNNFLALISDESPQEALAELERLEQRNPDFSPIPAQQALVLKKLGYMDRAQDKMMRAIELSPENLSYKFNLAVMLDSSGHYADASALYRLLIDAALKGEKLPVSLDTIQKRLNFIAAVPAQSGAIGG